MKQRLRCSDTAQFSAKRLRSEQTDAETILWSYLRGSRLEGYKFKRQHPVGKYVLDFYCSLCRLAIELDGGQHNEEEQRGKDQERTNYFRKLGIKVIRFWNHEVFENIDGVLEEIKMQLSEVVELE
jgi:very-short-patch-repair endonuclease